MEQVLEAAAAAGATAAGYTMLRLPYEVKDLFREWLQVHAPLKAAHVMSLVQQSRGGKDYDADFATRMRGSGPFAELIAQRFALMRRRIGLDKPQAAMNLQAFRIPARAGDQLGLF
jgi:DNA repair photolyase